MFSASRRCTAHWMAYCAVAMLCGMPSAAQMQSESHQRRFENPKITLARTDRNLTRKLLAHPTDAVSLHERGLIRLQEGRVQDAVADLQAAVRLVPQSSRAHSDFAMALFNAGETQQAMAAARRAISLDSRNYGAEALLGRMLLVSDNDPHAAIQHMTRSLEIDADQPDLRFDLINALRQIKDYMAAGVQARILNVSLPPGDARREYATASIDLDLGHADAAVLHLRRALQVNPNFLAARQDLAAALVQLARWEEASEIIGPMVQQQPQSAQLAYMDALVLENTHHPAAAEVEAKRAIRLKPDYAEAYVALGVSEGVQGDHSAAIKSLEDASALQPNNFDALFYLGREKYAIDALGGATQSLQSAVRIRPDDPEARFLLGTALESSGDKDAAMAQYRELIRIRPEDPRGHIGLGSILLRYGDSAAAMAELDKAQELDPTNFEVAMDIGKVLAQQGKLRESIRYLREASQEAPQSPEAHYQLALTLRRAGRNAEAAQEFAAVDRLNQERRGVKPISPN